MEQVPLKEHIDKLFEERDKRYDQKFADTKIAVDAALAASEKAVIKAESAAERRFESVNEFRSTLADQQRTLMPRAETEALFKVMNDKIEILNTKENKSEGKTLGITQLMGYILFAITVIGFIISRLV
jgi:hypothetical protein